MRTRVLTGGLVVAATAAGIAMGSASSPDGATAASPRAGTWAGRTDAGAAIGFRVNSGRTAIVRLRTRVRYSCGGNAPIVKRFAPTVRFRIRRGRFSGTVGTITVRGRFVRSGRVRGTIRLFRRFSEHTVCEGMQSWTARRR